MYVQHQINSVCIAHEKLRKDVDNYHFHVFATRLFGPAAVF